jgi:hypothetical protein
MSKNIEWKKSEFNYDELNELSHAKLAQSDAGKNNKGIKHTEETKQKLSNAKKGKKIPTETVEKSRRGIIQTKWEQTLARLSKQDILDAQLKHGNHQTNTMNELGISFNPYKKLCKYYGIELKKSIYEKSEFARENQSDKVNVYLYDKTKEDGLGQFVGTYYSIAEGCRQLNLLKNRCAAVLVSNGKRPHTNGYVFRKTKNNQ